MDLNWHIWNIRNDWDPEFTADEQSKWEAELTLYLAAQGGDPGALCQVQRREDEFNTEMAGLYAEEKRLHI